MAAASPDPRSLSTGRGSRAAAAPTPVLTVAADATVFNWRVTVLSRTGKPRRTLYFSTTTASAEEAYDAVQSIMEPWPPGSRVVELVPAGDDVGLRDDGLRDDG